MSHSPFLATELENRFRQLPASERDDPRSLIRITVELTRDLMQDCPQRVDEFLRMLRSVN